MVSHEDYGAKATAYFQVAQREVADFIAGDAHRILEIGCGEGYTGAYLKQTGKAREVIGIELVPAAAEQAAKKLDSVLTGNLETMDFPFEPHSFDYIVATEVLEHMVAPDKLLRRLRALLRPEGKLIASVPNMRHLRLVWQLIMQADWKYQDSGPMDRTHLRFFTEKSLRRLFVESGFEVEQTSPVLLSKARTINTVTLSAFQGFLAFRYFCVGHPAGD